MSVGMHSNTAASQHADAVTLEIVQNNPYIAREMEACLAPLLDVQGRLLAEEAGPPIQLSTVGICLQSTLKGPMPAESWGKQGDVVLFNDPYHNGESLAVTHTNDRPTASQMASARRHRPCWPRRKARLTAGPSGAQWPMRCSLRPQV